MSGDGPSCGISVANSNDAVTGVAVVKSENLSIKEIIVTNSTSIPYIWMDLV